MEGLTLTQEAEWLEHLSLNIGIAPIAELLETDEETVKGLYQGLVEISPEMQDGLANLRSYFVDLTPAVEPARRARPGRQAEPKKPMSSP